MLLGFQTSTPVSSPPEATSVSFLFQTEQMIEFYDLKRPSSLPCMLQTRAMLSYAEVSNLSPLWLHWMLEMKWFSSALSGILLSSAKLMWRSCIQGEVI